MSKCRGELSAPTSSLTRGSMCVVLAYLAYNAAIRAPLLVPPTTSTGTPKSSSARSAPRCANPCPPPPVSMTPTARPATCLASRSTSSSDDRRSMWCLSTSGLEARHLAVERGAQPGSCTKMSSTAAPRLRRHSRRRSARDGVTPGKSRSDSFVSCVVRATTKTRSACDTHTCDHALPEASACNKINL